MQFSVVVTPVLEGYIVVIYDVYTACQPLKIRHFGMDNIRQLLKEYSSHFWMICLNAAPSPFPENSHIVSEQTAYLSACQIFDIMCKYSRIISLDHLRFIKKE